MTIDIGKFSHCRPEYPVKRRGKDGFNPLVRVPPGFQETALRVRHLDSELDRFVLTAKDLFDLVADAFSVNVHYSTEIEGNPLPLEEVKRITRNTFRGMREPKPDAPMQEIINHLSTWLMPGYYKLPWARQKIIDTHKFLVGHDPRSDPGAFRTDDRSVQNDEGIEFFIPAPMERIETEMDWLLRWINEYSTGYDPLVSGPLIFHEFESIHPFKDGNGRTGRTLFHAYLNNSGLPNASLCKIEQHLLGNKQLYYDILAWTDKQLEYTDLIDYMSQAILESYEEAVELFSGKDILSKEMNETARRLIIRAKKEGDWFSVTDAVKWIGGLSSETVRLRLNEFVEMGVLEADGHTRSKRYHYSNPLSMAQSAMRK
ncbi:MAG: Fic family protein [Euryarchaeota archaeon]|nr:Fic family protein [Euryarchaeota archaeon]